MEVTPELSQYTKIIEGLHDSWQAHPGQVKIGKALFQDGFKEIFAQCGRNFGKTDLVGYCLWRWAMMNPGSENYYFSPFMKQSREIIWATNRLQRFGPKEWVKSINNTEMRITFHNGSFIKCDGSDNVDAYRGVKPKGVSVFDEFKDFKPEFYDAYEPNRAAYESPIVLIGTPPDRECQYLDLSREFETNPKKFFYRGPSWENPHISREWLEEQRRILIERGEEDVWQREYEAKYVPGGVSKIFPMVDRSYVLPHDRIIRNIRRDYKKLEWFVCSDPAAATVFGVLFGALNRYKKEWFILDELYITEPGLMSVDQVGRRIFEKCEEWPLADWFKTYDEASTWFANEMLDRFDDAWHPTHKHLNKKEDGLSLQKDIFLAKKEFISDRCVKYFWELDNYYKDKNGKIPKENDHLIDCRRYMNGAANYVLNEEKEYIESRDENFRAAKISDDFPELDEFGEYIDDMEWG